MQSSRMAITCFHISGRPLSEPTLVVSMLNLCLASPEDGARSVVIVSDTCRCVNHIQWSGSLRPSLRSISSPCSLCVTKTRLTKHASSRRTCIRSILASMPHFGSASPVHPAMQNHILEHQCLSWPEHVGHTRPKHSVQSMSRL